MRKLIAACLAAAVAVWAIAVHTVADGWAQLFAGGFAQFSAVTKETAERSFATRTTPTWSLENPFQILGSNCYVGSPSSPERADQHRTRPVSFNAKTRLDTCLA